MNNVFESDSSFCNQIKTQVLHITYGQYYKTFYGRNVFVTSTLVLYFRTSMEPTTVELRTQRLTNGRLPALLTNLRLG